MVQSAEMKSARQQSISLPCRIHAFSSHLSQLHCSLCRVIHLWLTVEIASLVVLVFWNWFSESGSVQTKRQGEMTLPVTLFTTCFGKSKFKFVFDSH